MPWKSVKLNDGRHMPGVGFGSAGHPKEKTADIIEMAIGCGFEHIDTAQIYYNEKEVGDGLKLAHLPRDQIWVTTKWGGKKSCAESIADSLEWLGVDYVDLYLIHNPRWVGDDLVAAWREMEKVKKEGKAKSIGVSNYSVKQLEQIIKECDVVPTVNQILLHPVALADGETKDLMAFHEKHNIVTQGYSPVRPLRDGSAPGLVKVVDGIAKKRGVESDQIALAWSRAKGAIPITTSKTESRIKGYLAAGDIELTKEEIKEIDKAGRKVSTHQAYKRGLMGVVKGGLALWVGYRVCAWAMASLTK